jgi:hypothetical protein
MLGHPNLYGYDLFNDLAENDPESSDLDMLNKDFRNGADSHSNETANLQIALKIAYFANSKIEQIRNSMSLD